jgi:hypothetical protein
MFTHQIIDITWKFEEGKYFPVWRLFELAKKERQTIPFEGYKFQFELSDEKRCVGYNSPDGWVPCQYNSLITKKHYTQCYYCERDQGFKSAFLFGGEPNELAKKHLSQEHFVYLAYFEPDILKVGTAASSRNKIRPIEQDALIYAYIAKVENGFRVQELEGAISRELGIRQTVKSRHKLKALSIKPDYSRVSEMIRSNYDRIYDRFKTNEIFSNWLFKPEEIEVVDLTKLPNLYYPENQVILLENELNLFGNFKGLRGRYTIFENNGRDFAFDERDIIGRKIAWRDEEYRYNVGDGKVDEQVGLF